MTTIAWHCRNFARAKFTFNRIIWPPIGPPLTSIRLAPASILRSALCQFALPYAAVDYIFILNFPLSFCCIQAENTGSFDKVATATYGGEAVGMTGCLWLNMGGRLWVAVVWLGFDCLIHILPHDTPAIKYLAKVHSHMHGTHTHTHIHTATLT